MMSWKSIEPKRENLTWVDRFTYGQAMDSAGTWFRELSESEQHTAVRTFRELAAEATPGVNRWKMIDIAGEHIAVLLMWRKGKPIPRVAAADAFVDYVLALRGLECVERANGEHAATTIGWTHDDEAEDK